MLGRKSLVVGALTSVGLVVADATGASAAEVADPVGSVPRWAPFTQYAGGRQVISPNNDVVSAKVAHRSSAAYVTDTAKWTLSSTYLTPTAANSTYLSRYVGASTAANTARVVQKLRRGVSDVTILYIGDSTGNAIDEHVYLTAQALATRFPTYTVQHSFWDEAGGAAYQAATTLQTGSGPWTLRIWNCSKSGEIPGYVLGSRWTVAIAATLPDLVVLSHGHNIGDPTGVAWRESAGRSGYMSLTEEIAAQFPLAGIVLVAQNPSLIVGRETWQAIKADALADLAALRGYGFIDVHQAFVDTGNVAGLTLDLTHPNSAGSLLWRDVMGAALTDAGTAVGRITPPPLLTQGRNLLGNSDFGAWTSTDPDSWTPTLATTSKDTTNFETGADSCKITAAAGSGFAQIEQSINLTTAGLKALRGQIVTIAVRVYQPASNVATTRMMLLDNTGTVNARSGDVPSSTRDRFVWIFATKRLDAAATNIFVRLSPRTSGSAVVEMSVDRVYLLWGVQPNCG